MIIRKKFKFEGAHIVRNCSTDRCKKSIHGHSYEVEVFFTSNKVRQWLYDFRFWINENAYQKYNRFFDHAYTLWVGEYDNFKNFFKSKLRTLDRDARIA